MMTHTYSHLYPRLIACTNTHTSRGAFLPLASTCMLRYTQLAYLFYHSGTSHLSKDSRIADCSVRHPDVYRSFSSLYCEIYCSLWSEIVGAQKF